MMLLPWRKPKGRTHAIPLPEGMLTIHIDVPRLPGGLREAAFAEHRGSQVICTARDNIAVSSNLGQTWRKVALARHTRQPVLRAFTTASGIHILQTAGWMSPDDDGRAPEDMATLVRIDSDWRFLSLARAGTVNWHGRSSIDEADGVIMYAEYPDNAFAYREQGPPPHRPSRVWRSRDDGATWECVFTVGEGAIRHFHTCVADPRHRGRWWLSSGDRPQECRVWVSDDAGDSWRDLTNPAPSVDLHPEFTSSRSVQRFTDLHFDGDGLLWGADDHLGPLDRVGEVGDRRQWPGSRLYRSRVSDPLEPEDLGWIGLPVRSLVDAGFGWFVFTEAKRRNFSLRPQVYLLMKGSYRLRHLFDMDNFTGKPTPFTHSVASRHATPDGTFFTRRSRGDVFPDGPAILRWRVSLT